MSNCSKSKCTVSDDSSYNGDPKFKATITKGDVLIFLDGRETLGLRKALRAIDQILGIFGLDRLIAIAIISALVIIDDFRSDNNHQLTLFTSIRCLAEELTNQRDVTKDWPFSECSLTSS